MRATLNLGHTFGHAIETATGYGTFLHGEAVSIGMVMAADMSVRLVSTLGRGRVPVMGGGLGGRCRQHGACPHRSAAGCYSQCCGSGQKVWHGCSSALQRPNCLPPSFC